MASRFSVSRIGCERLDLSLCLDSLVVAGEDVEVIGNGRVAVVDGGNDVARGVGGVDGEFGG